MAFRVQSAALNALLCWLTGLVAYLGTMRHITFKITIYFQQFTNKSLVHLLRKDSTPPNERPQNSKHQSTNTYSNTSKGTGMAEPLSKRLTSKRQHKGPTTIHFKIKQKRLTMSKTYKQAIKGYHQLVRVN